MAFRRRSLLSSFSHISRRPAAAIPLPANPIFPGRDDCDPPPPPQPYPIPLGGRGLLNRPPRAHFGAAPSSRHLKSLAFCAPSLAELGGRRRSYSSAPGGSNEAEIIKDVAEAITEASSGVSGAAPSLFSGEVTAAAADSFLPIAVLQHTIDTIHSFTGLNWWAAIALTTVLIRTATVPLLIKQMKATIKLNELKPEMEELKEQIQNSMDPETVQKGQQRMQALFRKHGVTPFTPLKGVFIQGPLFVCFFLAISNMVEKVPSFKVGGAHWFTDLTTPDPMYVLPVLTSAAFLITIELNMQEGMEGNPMAKTMKNFSRVIGLLTIPFTASFPKAIFFYWITSNLFSLVYGFVIKRPPVRKFLNIPDVAPRPAASSTPPTFSFFGAPKQITPAAAPSPEAAQPDGSKSAERKASPPSAIGQQIRSLEKKVKHRNKSRKR